MALQDDFAYRQAFDLVKTGIQSGAIKLHGVTTPTGAAQHGAADAAYLVALITALRGELPNE